MTSKIKSSSRTEEQTYLVFERDENTVNNIEKTFQKLVIDFKLFNYRKKVGDKFLDGFWEIQKKGEEFNFSLVVRKDIVRFKLKSNLDFMNEFIKNLEEYTEFSKLSPKAKIRSEKIGL